MWLWWRSEWNVLCIKWRNDENQVGDDHWSPTSWWRTWTTQWTQLGIKCDHDYLIHSYIDSCLHAYLMHQMFDVFYSESNAILIPIHCWYFSSCFSSLLFYSLMSILIRESCDVMSSIVISQSNMICQRELSRQWNVKWNDMNNSVTNQWMNPWMSEWINAIKRKTRKSKANGIE